MALNKSEKAKFKTLKKRKREKKTSWLNIKVIRPLYA